MQISAIILAAGSGVRTGLKYNKVLYEIHGKKIIDYSIETMRSILEIEEIILVVSPNEYDYFYKMYSNKVDIIVKGGAERQDSVFKALSEANCGKVIIHDGARPFIPLSALHSIVKLLEKEPSITCGVPVKNTIQKVDGNRVVETLKRDSLIVTQTPQAFDVSLLMKAHVSAQKDKYYGTDDTMLIEKYAKIGAYVVEGDYRNIKLTTIDDIKLLEVILL